MARKVHEDDTREERKPFFDPESVMEREQKEVEERAKAKTGAFGRTRVRRKEPEEFRLRAQKKGVPKYRDIIEKQLETQI